jgi:hypothetical protein
MGVVRHLRDHVGEDFHFNPSIILATNILVAMTVVNVLAMTNIGGGGVCGMNMVVAAAVEVTLMIVNS